MFLPLAVLGAQRDLRKRGMITFVPRVPSPSPTSLRNSTPRWARLTAPGLASPEPPPISAASELVWCGAMNGGAVISGVSGASRPATECTAVTSSASWSVSSGNSPTIRWASMVLPVPGGPVSSR